MTNLEITSFAKTLCEGLKQYLKNENIKINDVDFQELENILINTFTVDNITDKNRYYYVFKNYQIMNKEYKYIFNKNENFINIIREGVIHS